MANKMIIGLGNFPKEYEKTRHNAGFMVIDRLCQSLNISLTESNFSGSYAKVKVGNDTFIIGKPLTLMNLSGNFVAPLANFFKVNPEDILVVSDDADTNVGTLRIKKSGSSGGQNGLKDISNKLGTQLFPRIRIGIGRPENKMINLADYVLSSFNLQEKNIINPVLDRAVEAIVDYMNGSTIETIMNRHNVSLDKN